jgi:hypothetical protein
MVRKLSRREFLRKSAAAGAGTLLAACTAKETVVVEKPVEKEVTRER